MSHDTGHQAPGGYPPAAGTETDAIDVRDVTAAKPFASLTTRDYVTDAVAAVLLLVSLSLTWRLPSFSPQPASDVAWALPVTLLALAALVLPYLARLGAFPGSWSVHTTRRWRLLLTAPYGLAVLAQVLPPHDRVAVLARVCHRRHPAEHSPVVVRLILCGRAVRWTCCQQCRAGHHGSLREGCGAQVVVDVEDLQALEGMARGRHGPHH